MSSDLSSKDKELHRITDEILHYVWDPIGVSCFPQARDEYYTYSAQAFGLLKEGATQDAITEYLGRVSTERMGLTANPENDINAANLLCEWREVINEKFAQPIHQAGHAKACHLCQTLGTMKIGIAIFRWLLLLASVALCLIYLNSAVYRAWVAGGPPTQNPQGWLFSAGNYFSWALAFLSAGIGSFLLIGRLPALSKVSFAFLFLSGILASVPSAREFVAKNTCLDVGGKWSARELRCAYE